MFDSGSGSEYATWDTAEIIEFRRDVESDLTKPLDLQRYDPDSDIKVRWQAIVDVCSRELKFREMKGGDSGSSSEYATWDTARIIEFRRDVESDLAKPLDLQRYDPDSDIKVRWQAIVDACSRELKFREAEGLRQ